MKRIYFKKINFLISLILLNGCDWEHTYYYNVNNSTDKPISVNIRTIDSFDSSINIQPLSESTISIYQTFGNNISNYKIEPSKYFEYITIKQQDKQSLNDFRNDSLWEYYEDSKKSARYNLKVSSKDFK